MVKSAWRAILIYGPMVCMIASIVLGPFVGDWHTTASCLWLAIVLILYRQNFGDAFPW